MIYLLLSVPSSLLLAWTAGAVLLRRPSFLPAAIGSGLLTVHLVLAGLR